LIAFLHLWLKFCKGIDKYWIVPVRKLFYFHHWTIVPISKNKNGNMSDTPNYRPVAAATVVSKLLKHFILFCISPFLGTTDNQFGFKAGHSGPSDQCTFLLNHTASYFVTHGSSVHAVFLDATSKAFDWVLHMKLFEKPIQRKVPMCFVRPLKHWYNEQIMQLKWGKHLSDPFHVSDGVNRQGWVLSLYLFAVYLDDLSNELHNMKAWCYIGEVLLNHLIFVCFVQVYVGCKEYQMCVRLMQIHMGLFSTATKLFVWRKKHG